MHALLKSYAHTGDEGWLGHTSICLADVSGGPDAGAKRSFVPHFPARGQAGGETRYRLPVASCAVVVSAVRATK
jgi:hypothetical protein